MTVNLEIPDELGQLIAGSASELPRTLLESAALEALRTSRLTVPQARRLLGISSRNDMDGFLKSHGMFLDVTLEDIRRDSELVRSSIG
jgi:hypothetical protein